MNIEIMRELLASNKVLSRQLKDLELRVSKKLAVQDKAIAVILKTIRELMASAVRKNRPIGFTANLDE